MIKKIFFLLILLPGFFNVSSQTGPGGVGTSANNVLWLKADAGTSSSVNGTPISSWNDQSGNGLGVTQTVSAQQPSFSTSVMNGFPSIQFDNSTTANQNDKMIGPDSPLLDNTTGYSFFTVTRPLSLDNSNARAIVSKRTGVSIDQSFMLFYYTSNKLNIDVQTTDNRFASNTTYSNNTNYLTNLIYDGAAATASRCALYNEETFDKFSSETNTLVPDNNSPLLVGTTDAGDGRPFGGYISEIIIYREALGVAQRIILNNYLSAKYNIALAANDKYAGDNTGNGDYDREVAGLGQESTGSSPSFSASISGGLTMSANSGLDNGDYILTGHALVTNTTITTDVGGMTGSNKARWQRIWYVDVTNAATSININIEFDMSDGGMGTFTLGTLSNYVLLYRAGQSGNWTEVASASAISGDKIIFNALGATGDGYITLGTRDFHNSPLPVTLLSFTAIPGNTSVELRWSTASEKNNEQFILERSKDGAAFEAFATVKGAGSSSNFHAYQSTDKNPFAGTSYYRLRQKDYDGTIHSSDVIAVDLRSNAEALILFPNPNTGSFKIKLPSDQTQITFSICDVSGKELVPGTLVSRNPDGLFSIHTPVQLPPGTYALCVWAGEKKYSRKLVIR